MRKEELLVTLSWFVIMWVWGTVLELQTRNKKKTLVGRVFFFFWLNFAQKKKIKIKNSKIKLFLRFSNAKMRDGSF